MKPTEIVSMGLDVHRKFSTATACDARGRRVQRYRFEHADRPLLREALREFPRGMPVVLEGTFGWSWLSDELLEAGLDPHLASSRKVAAWREARGLAKSNRTDADLLSELWGQQPRWWEVWLAPRDVREQRERLRYRMSLVRWQTGLKNRIHAVLHRHGIVHEFSDLFGVAGRRFLQTLVTPAAAKNEALITPLPESGQACMQGYLQLLDHLRRQIAQVTRQVRGFVRRTPAARRLRTLPGVNYILAHTILAEVGRIERFKSAKHLSSYSLLAPRAYDSGEDDGSAPLGRHVGRMGRRTLKWAWIQAAHGAVRKDASFRALFDRRTNEGKRDRNRGYISVAHRLCQVGYVLCKNDVDYRVPGPPRPGITPHAPESRSGTGRPDPAMVAVPTSSELQTSL